MVEKVTQLIQTHTFVEKVVKKELRQRKKTKLKISSLLVMD